MAGAFRLNLPFLARKYGAGLPEAAQYMVTQSALPLVGVPGYDVEYFVDPDGEFVPRGKSYIRAEGATFQQVNTKASTATVSLNEHALEIGTDRKRLGASNYEGLREARRLKVLMELIGDAESELVTFFETAGNFGNSQTASAAGGQWSSDGSDPLAQIATEVRGVRTATGGVAGTMHLAITENQRDVLVNHAKVREAIKYTGGIVGDAELAAYFRSVGIDRMHVKRSIKSSTSEPVAFAGADFFSDNAEVWLAQDESSVVNDGSWGKIFWWDGDNLGQRELFAGLPLIRMEMGYREETDADIDRGRAHWAMVKTNGNAARRLTDCLA